jgi:hypothetical protein
LTRIALDFWAEAQAMTDWLRSEVEAHPDNRHCLRFWEQSERRTQQALRDLTRRMAPYVDARGPNGAPAGFREDET